MRPVLIAERLLADLKRMAETALPFETGGVLVGVKARGSIWIVGVAELGQSCSPGHYIVPKGATQPAVQRARESIDARVGYAGEWHSHTGDFGLSATDRAAMRAISWFAAGPGLGGPCLVLVRCTSAGPVVDAFRSRFLQLLAVPLMPTGPFMP